MVPHVYNINDKIVNGEIGDLIKIPKRYMKDIGENC